MGDPRTFDEDGLPVEAWSFGPGLAGSVVGYTIALTLYKLGNNAFLCAVIAMVADDFVTHLICILKGWAPGRSMMLWRLPSKGRYFAHLLVAGVSLGLVITFFASR